MVFRTLLYRTAIVTFLLIGLPHAASAQFEDLLRRLPSIGNALVLIDVEAIHQSPLAKRERWKETYDTEFAQRALILPPEASRIALAAQLETSEDLRPRWELAVMQLSESMSMRSIARAEGGYVDTIDGVQAVWTPSNAYFIKLAPQMLGLMYPDNRQAVVRWNKFGQENKSVALSSYLQEAAERINKDGQIIMALDLQNAVQPHRLDQRLDDMEIFNDKKADLNSVADSIMGLRGVTLSIKIGSERTGKIRIDFDRDISALRPFAKAIVLAVLEENGAAIEEFAQWKFDVGYNVITMEGGLSKDSMRRISSVLEIPTTKFSTLADETSSPADNSPTGKDSLRYFKSLTVLVDDLNRSLRGRKQNVSLWMEKYARKIDRMPILRVDEDLLAFGIDVAESFRNMATSKRSSLIRGGVRRSSTYGNYYAYGSRGRYNSGYYTRPGSQRIQIRTQEKARATNVKIKGFEDIENNLAKIRQKMTAKYTIEF